MSSVLNCFCSWLKFKIKFLIAAEKQPIVLSLTALWRNCFNCYFEFLSVADQFKRENLGQRIYTDQVIGSDDVAASDNIGVLNGTPSWQLGSTSGSLCRRQLLAWRSPISSMYNRRSPGLRHSRCMWALGDQVVRDRLKGHIAERSGRLA